MNFAIENNYFLKYLRLFRTILLVLCLTLFIRCSSSDNGQTPPEQQLEDILTELVYFNYTPQIGATPDRLQYEFTFTNPNDVGVVGFYSVTTIATFGVEQIEASLLSKNFSECYEVQANSTCTFVFDESGDINIGSADSIEFVTASYRIESTF